MINVERAGLVARKLQSYINIVLMKIDSDIFFVGENVKERLQLKFPEISIIGIFSQSEHLYTLTISIQGKEFKWIWCEKYHRYFKKVRDQTETGQEMRSTIPDIFEEINKVLDTISMDLIERINPSIIYERI